MGHAASVALSFGGGMGHEASVGLSLEGEQGMKQVLN